jgi:hypothetical protein
MPKTTRAQVKEENEIQSYINSFKEMEEEEESETTSKVAVKKQSKTRSKPVFVTPIVEEEEEEEEEEEAGEEEEYKYVFIVQDDEEMDEDKVPGEGEEEVYEFEDFGDEDMLEEMDDKSKIPRIAKVSTLKKNASVGLANHVCNFCNYSTNKRYLLARHMKVSEIGLETELKVQ